MAAGLDAYQTQEMAAVLTNIAAALWNRTMAPEVASVRLEELAASMREVLETQERQTTIRRYAARLKHRIDAEFPLTAS